MSSRRIPVALTAGDPVGVGPEIAAGLLARAGDRGADIFLVGSAPHLLAAIGAAGAAPPPVLEAEAAVGGPMPARFPVIVDIPAPGPVAPGGPSAASGAVSGGAIETAARMARGGRVEAIVTGPVSKEALRLAGYPWRGHTEMLADLFDAPDCQMMMVSGAMRIVILTRDIPLRDVPAAVTQARLAAGIRVTAGALRSLWGIERPSIAVAALNPHAGDGGVTGMEEIDTIRPALEALRGEGIDARGPFPADTLFMDSRRRTFDAIVALYHDQGMIPFKIGGFDEGVNMTIGLPVLRTSVCHGTAYDIAGTGTAESGSLRTALDVAVECCRRSAGSTV
jgi:4-hydroxythreonine-4-phosphate dehydrogenase